MLLIGFFATTDQYYVVESFSDSQRKFGLDRSHGLFIYMIFSAQI